MRRLIYSLMAGLAALPVAVIAGLPGASSASAEGNGVGLTPAMGWSSWSFLRHGPNAAQHRGRSRRDEEQRSGGRRLPVRQPRRLLVPVPRVEGPNVDQYGRWVTDTTRFPPGPGRQNGIQVVASYVHSLGLKFGLYVTPGISHQAVVQNTAIEGTPYHADDIATTAAENNYNCRGMVGIDYTKPGAQAFINSWADEFASWGVDYLKIDGVGSFDIPDVGPGRTRCARPVGRSISSCRTASTSTTHQRWAQYSNGWRTGGDIECYGCETGGVQLPADLLVATSRRGSTRSRPGSRTAGRAASTTTTRSRSATAATTG